jgi:hypothetical protein
VQSDADAGAARILLYSSGLRARRQPPANRMQMAAASTGYCFSYSPFPRRLRTVKPAFLASESDGGLDLTGELKVEMILRTGRRQAGQTFNGAALIGRRNVNWPPHTMQSPSHNSYSYIGMALVFNC